MAPWGEVSFYRDLLHRPVVDSEGHVVGALLDLAAGPAPSLSGYAAVLSMVLRPKRAIRRPGLQAPLVLPWDLVDSIDSRGVQLRCPCAELTSTSIAAGALLVRRHILDQQIVDCRGAKLLRVNDVTLDWMDGSLHLQGMDTGARGFLTRIGYGWGLLHLLRPLHERLRQRLIGWDLVDRVEPSRGTIRLRLPREAIQAAGDPVA